MQIFTYYIETIPTKRTDKYVANTLCIFQIEIDEIIGIQNSKLVMLPTAYSKGEANPGKIRLTSINLSHNVVQVAKHTIIQYFGICGLSITTKS